MKKLSRLLTRHSNSMQHLSTAELMEKVLHDTKNMDLTGFTKEQLEEHAKLVKDTEKLWNDLKKHENKGY